MAEIWNHRADLAEAAIEDRHAVSLWGLPATNLAEVAWPSCLGVRLMFRWHYWWQAHYLDCQIDAALRTPTRHRRRRITRTIRAIRVRNIYRLSQNRYYDDKAWLALAFRRTRAVHKMGRVVYLRDLESNILHGINGHLGVLPWRRGDMFFNTPTNGPAAILFARSGHLDEARRMVDWMCEHLINDRGLVMDGIHKRSLLLEELRSLDQVRHDGDAQGVDEARNIDDPHDLGDVPRIRHGRIRRRKAAGRADGKAGAVAKATAGKTDRRQAKRTESRGLFHFLPFYPSRNVQLTPPSYDDELVTAVFPYCQGVLIGACHELANALDEKGQTEDAEIYRQRVRELVRATAKELANTRGVITVRTSGGDGGLFKGILARYLALVAVEHPGETDEDASTRRIASRLVLASAECAWNHRLEIDGLPVFPCEWDEDAQLPRNAGVVAKKVGGALRSSDIPERDLSVQLSGWMLMEAAARVVGWEKQQEK